MTRDARGWHSRGYLPHFDGTDATQFITFRLADSLPADVTRHLAKDSDDPWAFDQFLDKGAGACWLRQPPIAELVESALFHFDDQR